MATAKGWRVSDRFASALQILHWRNVPVMAVLCAGGVVMLLPFLWMFSAALRPAGEAYCLPPTLLPDVWDFASYSQVFSSGLPFLHMYWNSFVVAVTALVQTVCAPISRASNRLKAV